MKVKWIFFDVGATLIDEMEAYDHRAKEMIAGTDLTFEDFDAKRRELAAQGLEGNSAVVKYFGLTKTSWPGELEHPFPDAADTLAYLKEKGYSLGIIANQVPGLTKRMERWGLLPYFSVIASSAEMGVEKPNPEIFIKALEMAGCEPQDAVMIGDRLDNDILPAKKLGMRTVWVRTGLAQYQSREMGVGKAEQIIDHLIELKTLFPV